MNPHVLHGALGAPKPSIVSSDGIYMRDQNGRTFVDASGGAAVACLGHGHP